jgi:hypothetical protein
MLEACKCQWWSESRLWFMYVYSVGEGMSAILTVAVFSDIVEWVRESCRFQLDCCSWKLGKKGIYIFNKYKNSDCVEIKGMVCLVCQPETEAPRTVHTLKG